MRLVIDTNVLVSALFSETSLPAYLLNLWREGRFELLIASDQLDELRRVTRYPKVREHVPPALAGRFINELRDIAIVLDRLPVFEVCADQGDNYLLAMSIAGAADFLVTGDKRHLLVMGSYGGTRIITVRDFLTFTRRLP